MKSNLMLKKYSVNSVPGTMNQKELRTFFGGKVIYTEDNIYINNDTINFSQLVADYDNGFQYYDYNSASGWETQYYENLTDLKYNYQSIELYSQSDINLSNNTRWLITINAADILKSYLFFKIKERRVFRNVHSKEVYDNDINKAIYEYVNYNVFSRYRLDSINFYVEYYDLETQSVYENVKLQYKPEFKVDVYKSENLSNMSVIGYDPYKFETVKIQYNQSKSSQKYGFDYYFDLNFTKI
jgi:hypothetical protein